MHQMYLSVVDIYTTLQKTFDFPKISVSFHCNGVWKKKRVICCGLLPLSEKMILGGGKRVQFYLAFCANFPLVVLKWQRVRIGICRSLYKVTGILGQWFCRLHLPLQIHFTLRKMVFSQWHRRLGTKSMTFCMVTSPDALPLSDRRLMGAKASTLASWAKPSSLFSDY